MCELAAGTAAATWSHLLRWHAAEAAGASDFTGILPGFSEVSQAAESGAFKLRYVLASSLYGTLPLETVIAEVRKAGAEAIDIWPKHHADHREQMESLGFEKVRSLLEKHEVKLAILSRYDLGPFHLKEEMRLLRDFGGEVIVTGSGGPRNLEGEALKSAVAQFVRQLEPHVDEAEDHRICLAIENHSHSLICSEESILYFAEMAKSPNLGLALAPYHLPQDPKFLARLIERLGPKLLHFYAWQYGRGCMEPLPREEQLEQMPGRGPLDFRPIMAALQKINYSRYTEIFMHPVPRGVPICETAEKVTEEVNRAREYLERCLQEVEAT